MEPSQETPTPRVREGALIAAAIVAASLIISWGMSKSEPRYQLAASGNAVVRMDTDSDELIACSAAGCTRVQPPDRAKSFGIVGIKFDSSSEEPPAIDQKDLNAR
jgi:hypothetical protein